MKKKLIVTSVEIEKDIINALKKPAEKSKKDSKKGTIPVLLCMCIVFVIEFFYPLFILWFLLACMVIAIGVRIFGYCRLKIRIKKVSFNDYQITTEIVHSKKEEHYIVVSGGKWKRSHPVDNYTLRFENGQSWRISKDNYLWSEEYPMSDGVIYQNTHRGDTMIVVTKKKTEEIVMAYHTDFFQYKD